MSKPIKYAKSHEWIQVDSNGLATVGISDHAQRALGDVVFVELPVMDSTVSAGEEVAVVESVKAASDIYAPVSGVIVEVNTALHEAPELINSSPLGEGWLFKIRVADDAELDALLDEKDYVAANT